MMTGEEVWSYVQPVLIDAIRDKRLPGEVYMTVSRALMAMDKNGQERTGTDLISRQAAIDALHMHLMYRMGTDSNKKRLDEWINNLPSAQPEQRYTEEELMVFRHGISLSLLSKRSAQHWRYDEDTATEIEFLERLYEKVGADMRGEQDG
jgi:hypothetical protein